MDITHAQTHTHTTQCEYPTNDANDNDNTHAKAFAVDAVRADTDAAIKQWRDNISNSMWNDMPAHAHAHENN